MEFHEEAFEGAIEIVASALEENEVEISTEGGEAVGDFFEAIYKRLRAVAQGEEKKSGRPGSFEVYADARGEYRFRLKAANGQVIAVSEGYERKDSCLNGIESVKRSAPQAAVEEV